MIDNDFFANAVTDELLARDEAKRPYTGGLVDLTPRDARPVELPAMATARGYLPGKAAAFDVGHGRVLLFNSPGRMSLLPWNQDQSQLKLAGNFSGNVASSGITRAWQNPYRRVLVAFATNKLAGGFPDGVIPGETQKRMLAEAL